MHVSEYRLSESLIESVNPSLIYIN